tara:strand:- start:43539 stop:43739 length:201 start_codon:yes stop_codon:yes gene_type:complete
MTVYIVIEQEYGLPSNLLVCFNDESKSQGFIDGYPKSDVCGYSIKSMKISREVSKELTKLNTKQDV